jgi:hypothetical protein
MCMTGQFDIQLYVPPSVHAAIDRQTGIQHCVYICSLPTTDRQGTHLWSSQCMDTQTCFVVHLSLAGLPWTDRQVVQHCANAPTQPWTDRTLISELHNVPVWTPRHVLLYIAISGQTLMDRQTGHTSSTVQPWTAQTTICKWTDRTAPLVAIQS